MSHFLTPGLKTDLVDEFEDIHQLLEPLVFYSDTLGRIEVPAGFRTDFASVPRIVGAYLLFGGKGKRAAVVHDWLYSGGMAVTREQADEAFREALRCTGYGWITVAAMYAGVRLGGGFHFNEPNVPQEPEVAAEMEAP